MNKMTKIKNCIFIVMFMAMLIVPAVLMDHEKYKSSDIDNKTLTEWPGFSMDTETIRTIEDYVDDRIGFRSQAILGYTKASNDIFKVMVHPLFMYGQNDHIYYKDPAYIAAYQRLNTDPEYMDSFVDFLEKTNEYLKSKNIKFVYFLAPDKKSIYPEYFPKSIHVKQDESSVIEYMSSRLSGTDIEYVIPYEELLAAKENQVIYNQKYDATHWNEFGSFIGQKLLDDKIQQWFDDIKPLSADDYSLNYEKRTNLDQSDFPIDDDVPVYTLNVDTSQDASGYLAGDIKISVPTFYAHYMNPEVTNGKRIVIFTDSYFATYSKYYTNRFSEVFYIHRQNFEYVQYMVNLLFPDVVVYETAERSITGDMPLLDEYDGYYYEDPYAVVSAEGLEEESLDQDIECSIIKTEGGISLDGDRLLIDPNAQNSIASFIGILTNYDKSKDYEVYVSVEGNCFETDYQALHKQSEEEGVKYFEFDIQRRYLAPCNMVIKVVDKKNGKEFVVKNIEVCYVE